jgi:hypothetical protein
MGLTRLHFSDPASPILAQDDRHSYVWATLEKDGALKPSDDAIVVESPWAHTKINPGRFPTVRSTPLPKPKPVSQPVATEPAGPVVTNSAVPDNGATDTTPSTSPIEQAIHLRSVLREALTATNDLIGSLKRQQKQQRAYKTAIASLKELQGVA